MEEYLTDLTQSLLTAYGYSTQNLALHIDVPSKWLDVDKALPLGLIANEIVTNALKYAFLNVDHPALDISLKNISETIILTIWDNGSTFDAKEWSGNTGSFGKQLIATLCSQLNATQKLATANGTTFSFIIPYAKAA
jgi:two-component sensor histidine kinase